MLDLATGAKRLLTPKGTEKVAYGGGRFAADGRRIFVTTDRDSEFLRLAAIDLASGVTPYFTSHIPWDVELFGPLPRRLDDRVCHQRGRALACCACSTPPPARSAGARARAGVGLIGGIDWRPGSHELAFSFVNARSANDVYTYDVDSGRTRALDRERDRRPQRRAAPGGRADLVEELRRPRDLRVPLPPAGALRRQAAGDRSTSTAAPRASRGRASMGRNNYFLNELGVASSTPTCAARPATARPSSQLDNGVKREDSVKDIGALLDWIATQPDLDPDRVMVMGGSYGGYMTLAVATHYNDRIRCAVDVVGISQLRHLPREHRGVPPRPAPRRVRRRARPEDARVPASASRR